MPDGAVQVPLGVLPVAGGGAPAEGAVGLVVVLGVLPGVLVDCVGVLAALDVLRGTAAGVAVLPGDAAVGPEPPEGLDTGSARAADTACRFR